VPADHLREKVKLYIQFFCEKELSYIFEL
jgi:hypothetical protein